MISARSPTLKIWICKKDKSGQGSNANNLDCLRGLHTKSHDLQRVSHTDDLDLLRVLHTITNSHDLQGFPIRAPRTGSQDLHVVNHTNDWSLLMAPHAKAMICKGFPY